MHKLLYPGRTLGFLRGLANNSRISRLLKLLRAYDVGTDNHSERVSLLCIDMGYENGLPDKDMLDLGCASRLHDIGKTGVPIGIINKNGPLTEEEMEIVKQHPRNGFLKLVEFGNAAAGKIIVQHHEYKKIGPYPRNGNGSDSAWRFNDRRSYGKDGRLAEYAQVLAAADMYDALASPRPYKAAWPRERIERAMREEFKGNPSYIDQVLRR